MLGTDERYRSQFQYRELFIETQAELLPWVGKIKYL